MYVYHGNLLLAIRKSGKKKYKKKYKKYKCIWQLAVSNPEKRDKKLQSAALDPDVKRLLQQGKKLASPYCVTLIHICISIPFVSKQNSKYV